LPEGRIFGQKLPFYCIGAMIEIVVFDPISDFAKFIALSRDQIITNPIRQLYAE
jgi:hypothetical protein